VRGQERKIATLVVSGLLAAIICFGLLESSGAVENPGYKFGGAFAGFLITIVILNRFWGPDSFEDQVARSGTEIAFEEIVKVLDLRQAPPGTNAQRVRLCDYRRVAKAKRERDLHLHYATTGDGIAFEGSATHPLTADWHTGPVTHLGPGGEQLKRQYDLNIPLAGVATGEIVPIAIEVTYVNAFKDAEREWLETHIDEPTHRLIMIVLMPDTMAATKAGIEIRKEGRKEPPRLPDPRVMLNGSMVYWSIDKPLPETRYALSWHWIARAGRTIREDPDGDSRTAEN
jgi:hypothetical protein